LDPLAELVLDGKTERQKKDRQKPVKKGW